MSDGDVTLWAMTGDRAVLSATLRAQGNVISRRQALACGVTRDALAHRLRPDGPWQRLCPGVYLAQTGAADMSQKEAAALLHAGPGSVLTGPAALYGLGLTTSQPRLFDVLVPVSRRPESVAFAVMHRTTRMPQRVIREGSRQYALPPRALADAARGLTELAEVRALIAGAVQQGHCPIAALERELGEGPIRRSGLLRQGHAAADGYRLTVDVVNGDFGGVDGTALVVQSLQQCGALKIAQRVREALGQSELLALSQFESRA